MVIIRQGVEYRNMNDHRHSRERFNGKAKAKARRLCVWLRPSVCPDPSFFEPVRMLGNDKG